MRAAPLVAVLALLVAALSPVARATDCPYSLCGGVFAGVCAAGVEPFPCKAVALCEGFVESSIVSGACPEPGQFMFCR